jgi:hypothetical protein
MCWRSFGTLAAKRSAVGPQLAKLITTQEVLSEVLTRFSGYGRYRR